MATYKVPQDVEADDKLIGPFSFRQFIYLIIVALSIAAAWGLGQVFIALAVIPLPFILLFGALALPLRKDQPMEIYLAAMVSFYLKPRKRLWDPDGIDTFIQITVPKVAQVQRTKDITREDAEQRFSYLANIVDSQGWAIRGAGTQSPSTTINNDIYVEAQSAQDVFDGSSSIAQSFNAMMNKETTRVRQEAIDHMRTPVVPALVAAVVPTQAPIQQTPTQTPPSLYTAPIEPAQPVFDPYPTNIQQMVIQPMNDPSHQAVQNTPTPPAQTSPTTSDKPISADIINLANNPDLSIETIAREAHRLQEKENEAEEVIISLR